MDYNETPTKGKIMFTAALCFLAFVLGGAAVNFYYTGIIQKLQRNFENTLSQEKHETWKAAWKSGWDRASNDFTTVRSNYERLTGKTE